MGISLTADIPALLQPRKWSLPSKKHIIESVLRTVDALNDGLERLSVRAAEIAKACGPQKPVYTAAEDFLESEINYYTRQEKPKPAAQTVPPEYIAFHIATAVRDGRRLDAVAYTHRLTQQYARTHPDIDPTSKMVTDLYKITDEWEGGSGKRVLSAPQIADVVKQPVSAVRSIIGKQPGLEPQSIDDYLSLYTAKTDKRSQRKREYLEQFQAAGYSGEALAKQLYYLNHTRPEGTHETLYKDKYVFTQKEIARMAGLTTSGLRRVIEHSHVPTRASLQRTLKQQQLAYIASLDIFDPKLVAKQLGIGVQTALRYRPVAYALAA